MKNIIYLNLIFFIILLTPRCFAQSSVKSQNTNQDVSIHDLGIDRADSLLLAPSLINDTSLHKIDSTLYLKRDSKGLIVLSREWTPLDFWYNFNDTMFYNAAFLPVIFDGNILPDNLSFITDENKNTEIKYHLIPADSTLKPFLDDVRKVKDLRFSYFSDINNMSNIKYSSENLSQIIPISAAPIKKNIFQDIITTEKPAAITTPELQKYVPKRVYWKKTGEHSLQVAQNYISDNWSKGGVSSYFVKSFQRVNINYAKDKLTFNNSIEWQLNFQNTSGDQYRDVRINTDRFRTYSLFGYKAYNNWSYSSSLEIITQIFNMYPENSNQRRSSLFSPLDVIFGPGMLYKLNKSFKNNLTRKVSLTANIAPLSMKFRYIMDDKVDETSFKLRKGHSTQTDLGSVIDSDLRYEFNNYITWTSRFKYWTDYESVVSEFENKLDVSLNRYFSTTLYLYLRYDENSKKDDKLKYVQINEMVSFGLNYKW